MSSILALNMLEREFPKFEDQPEQYREALSEWKYNKKVEENILTRKKCLSLGKKSTNDKSLERKDQSSVYARETLKRVIEEKGR